MAQQGLRQRDLVPILGSRSRVSEVLGRRRPLTIQMIRSLSNSLHIPLSALVSEPQLSVASESEVEISRLPIKEMIRRGWLGAIPPRPSLKLVKAAVSDFLDRAAAPPRIARTAYRRSAHGDGLTVHARYAAIAWTARISLKAQESKLATSYRPEFLTQDFLVAVAQASSLPDGVTRVLNLVRDIGIRVVIEPALPRSLLDGAAMMIDSSSPAIGLSVRFDRVDYYWFTLLHELAHVSRHLDTKGDVFLDRLVDFESTDPTEREANRIACDAVISQAVWCRSEAFLTPSLLSIKRLAAQLRVHPAIIAGRLQHDTKNYTRFRSLLGQGTVRRQLGLQST